MATTSENFADGEFDSEPEDGQFGMINLEVKVEYEKSHSEALDVISQLKMRLVRRTAMIDEIRKCYLRDVVIIKNVLHDVIIDSEREIVVKELASRLPSLDLTKSLPIHAPMNTELRISPCEACGGRVEAVMVDSDEVVKLQKVVSQMRERESRFKANLAELDAKLEVAVRDRAENSRQHHEEKRFLYSKMKEMEEAKQLVADEMDKVLKMNKKLRKQNEEVMNKGTDILTLTERLRSAEEEIQRSHKSMADDTAIIQQYKANEKKNKKEMNMLRVEIEVLRNESNKSNGRTSTRDVVISSLEYEIATLKTEIEFVALKLQKAVSTNEDLEQRNQDLVAESRDNASSKTAMRSSGDTSEAFDEIIAMSERLREEVKKWQNENEKLELKIKMLEEDITVLKKENEGLMLSIKQKEFSLKAENGQKQNNEDVSTEKRPQKSRTVEIPSSNDLKDGKYDFKRISPIVRRRHSIPDLFKFGNSNYNEGINSHGKLNVLESRIFGGNNDQTTAQSPASFQPKKRESRIHTQNQRQIKRSNSQTQGQFYSEKQDGKTEIVEDVPAAPAVPQVVNMVAPIKVSETSNVAAATKVEASKKASAPSQTTKKFVPPKETVVELLPPYGDSNDIELLLRNSFMKAMSSFPEMTQNAVYRSMNAIAPTIAKYSKLICRIMETAWDSIANGRCLLETILQINDVLSNMTTCIDSKTSKAQLDRICDKSSPLCESLPSPDWEPQLDEGHVFTDKIMCSVAAEIDEKGTWSYSKYESYFFHRDESKVQNCIEDFGRLVTQMAGFSRETFLKLGRNIFTVLMDWKAAKTVTIDLDNIVKQATEKIRIEADTKVSNMGRELQKQLEMFENASTQLADLKAFTKELLTMEESLRKCEELLSISEHNRVVYLEENGHLNIALEEMRSKMKKIETELRESKSQIKAVQKSLSEEVKTKREAQEKVLQLTKNLSEQFKICNSWEAAHDELIEKENIRRSDMRNVSMQWGPSSATVAVQTEFLTQPMTLRTVVADTFGKLSGGKYPLPIIVSQPQSSASSIGGGGGGGGSNLSVSSGGSSTYRTSIGSRNGGYDDNMSLSSNGHLSGRSMNSLNSSFSSISGVSFFQGAEVRVPSISLPYIDHFEMGDHPKDGRQDRLGLNSPTDTTILTIRGSMRTGRPIMESSNTLNLISRSGFILPQDLPNTSSPQKMSSNRSTSSLPSLLLKSGRGDGDEIPSGYNAFAPTPMRLRTADSTSSTRSKPRIDPYNTREIPSNTLHGTNFQQARVEGSSQDQSRTQQKNKAITQSIAALQKTQEKNMVPLL